MSKVATKQRTRSLKEANAEAREEAKGRKGIDKRVTTFKGDTGTGDGNGGTGSIDLAPMAPNEEQLAKINQFTRSPKTAEDLVVFPTLSANDLYDRDDERFVTQTVKEFAALPQPYSFVGKSFMVGHDYTKLPVGRIFDVGTKTVDLGATTTKGATGGTIDTTSKAMFLTNWVYVPKTASNQQFIENLDFGVNWAVSVGVMLEEAKCSLPWCGAPMYMSRFFGSWCASGHDKGYYYTEDATEDKWGYVDPADPNDPGAEMCRTDLYGAKDAYELSQVFLGAQFFAALDGNKTAKGILKAASARPVPIIGLSAEEAAVIEKAMPHLPPQAIEGVRLFGAKPDEDGILKWTDNNSLVWTFDPEAEDSEVQCLGKASDEDGEEGADGTEAASNEGGSDALGEGSEEQSESADDAADDGEGDDSEDGRVGSAEVEEGERSDGDLTASADKGSDDGAADDDDEEDADSDDEPDDDQKSGKEATVSKAAIVKALRGLDVPEAVLRAVESVKGTSLDAVLLPLASKAVLGDQFIASKRSEAIDWYVKANQSGQNVPVNVDTFTKILDAAGDNVDLIDHLIGQQKTLAQAKFPSSVTRRSSFPTDANTAQPGDGPTLPSDDDGVQAKSSQTVRRLHG